MNTIISEECLSHISNEELIKRIKDRGVYLYMYDGTMNEVRIKDLISLDVLTAKLVDYTGLTFLRQTIKSIEIMEEA